MKKQKSTPGYVTREILKEEISAPEERLTAKIGDVDERLDTKITGLDAKVVNVEKRLDAKIETTAQSLKEYTDSRFTKLDGKISDVDTKVKGLDAKLTKYFELMMQTFIRSDKETHKLLATYGERIEGLEGRKSN
jgi:hypothetical protein